MILVDTSAWIEFDRVPRSAADERLVDFIRTADEVAVAELGRSMSTVVELELDEARCVRELRFVRRR